jgi:hypothetical protein
MNSVIDLSSVIRVENGIQMNRRGALQKLGIIGALVGIPLTVESIAAKQNPEEGLQSGNFQFVTTDISIPKPEDAPTIISCSHYPHFIKSPTGTYLPAIELGDDDHSHMVSSPIGVDQFSNQYRIDYSMIPYDGSATGTYRAVSGDIELDPSLTVTGQGIQVDIAGEQTGVPPGESFSAKVQTAVEYETWEHNLKSETVDARVSVTNHGVQDLYWHAEKVLIPKDTEAGSQIKPMVGGDNAAVVEGEHEDSPRYMISDIPSASAYGISRKNRDHKNYTTTESETEDNRREE